MVERSSADRKNLLQQVAQERCCSLRTAARIVQQDSHRRETMDRMAIEVAAHCDWGDRTDIAQEIRELAEEIAQRGVRHVPNRYRNRIAGNMPHSLQVQRD